MDQRLPRPASDDTDTGFAGNALEGQLGITANRRAGVVQGLPEGASGWRGGFPKLHERRDRPLAHLLVSLAKCPASRAWRSLLVISP